MATRTTTIVYLVVKGAEHILVFHTMTAARKYAENNGGTIIERAVRNR